MNLKLGFAAVATLVAVHVHPAVAQTAMDMANEYPSGTIHAQIVDKFIEVLGEKSGGSIVVTAHHGGALGYKSADHFDAVGDGAVQLASSYSGAWAGIDPIFLASSLPFLATSVEDTRALYDATRPYYEKALEDNGQVFLYATPWPPSGIWAKKPIVTPADLQGLKIRASDASGVSTLLNAGASPVQLSWADVVPQLTTNGIDGVLTSADGGASALFWEYLTDFTEINYALPLELGHMNRDAFEALSAEEQEAVRAAAAEAETYGWALLEDRVKENYKALDEHGVTVTTEISPELEAAFKDAAAPVVEAWVERVGDDGKALLEDYKGRVAQ